MDDQHLCWSGIHYGIITVLQCLSCFLLLQNDSEEDSEKEVEATTAPRFISTGATFDDVQSLVLAAEGMVVCHFKQLNILTTVITLIASYYLFNADYPKGLGGHSKNIYLFLEHMLLPKLRHGSAAQLPISVETVIGKLNGMA